MPALWCQKGINTDVTDKALLDQYGKYRRKGDPNDSDDDDDDQQREIRQPS